MHRSPFDALDDSRASPNETRRGMNRLRQENEKRRCLLPRNLNFCFVRIFHTSCVLASVPSCCQFPYDA